MSLEVAAMRWLWLEKNCHYILRERTPRWGCGAPDVLGVTRDRFYIEIEIKRSYSDYLADFRKRHRINREHYLDQSPKFFYYLAPEKLAYVMIHRCPEWAGLLSLKHSTISVLKTAPANKASKKISIKECVKLARLMVSHAMSLEITIDHQMNNWKQTKYHEEYPLEDDFQI